MAVGTITERIVQIMSKEGHTVSTFARKLGIRQIILFRVEMYLTMKR